jgi:hypothetical protein
MRKGLIGPFQQGVLLGLSESLNIAERVTGQRGVDLEGIFYATAFQAGIDEFLLAGVGERPQPFSAFIRDQTRYLPAERSKRHYDTVETAFGKYLPEGWERDDKYLPVWSVQAFLIDLLNAMATPASLLSPWGIPDIAEAKALLPPELVVPVSNLLAAIEDLTTASPVPQRVLAREDLERFNRIITSDLFRHYVTAHEMLDNPQVPVATAVEAAANAGRRLFLGNPRLLALRRSFLGVLQITPKVVDAAFGKLPGLLAELGARLGLSLLESRRRIVIYDFRPTVMEVFLANLLRMFHAFKESAQE